MKRVLTLLMIFMRNPTADACSFSCAPAWDETPIEINNFTGSCIAQQCETGNCSQSNFPEADTGFIPPLCQFSLPWLINCGNSFLCYDTVSYSYDLYHPAVDLNQRRQDEVGALIHASANGYVVWARQVNDYNWASVLIKHKWRGEIWYTQYGHMDTVTVQTGQCVCQGQVLGTMGDMGAEGQRHLHFEVRQAGHPGNQPQYTAQQNAEWFSQLNLSSNVEDWYENPVLFVQTHGPYKCESAQAPERTFPDLNCFHWAYDAWQVMLDRNIIQGADCDAPLSGTCVYPDRNATRAEVCKFACKTFDVDLISDPHETFKDMCPSHTLYPYVATLADMGIINGRSECVGAEVNCDAGDNYFCPDDFVTAAETLKIFINTMNSQLALAKRVPVDNVDTCASNCTGEATCKAAHCFSDVSPFHSLCNYVEAAKREGFVSGYGECEFRPNEYATRSRIAQIAVRMLEEFQDRQ